MRKTILFILSITVLFIAFYSCDNTKTAQEYLREEKKAIERYIDRSGIKVLSSYPSDSIFKENEYLTTNDGLYLQVVDKGSDKRVRPLVDDVMVRFDYYFYVKDYVGGDTAKYKPNYQYFPLSFRYGISGSYGSSFVCNGWAIPLDYVGEGAIVNLIIPSSLGSQSDNQAYRPVFYKNLHYTKFK
jgi:hypothetical protein